MFILAKTDTTPFNPPCLLLRSLDALAGPGHYWEVSAFNGKAMRPGTIQLLAESQVDATIYYMLMGGMPEMRALRELLTPHAYTYATQAEMWRSATLNECSFWDGPTQHRLMALMWELGRRRCEEHLRHGNVIADGLMEQCCARRDQNLHIDGASQPLVLPTEVEVVEFISTAIQGYMGALMSQPSARSRRSRAVVPSKGRRSSIAAS